MHLFFILMMASLLFFMAVWVVVTAYRITKPEQPQPPDQHPVVQRQRAAAQGQYVSVGAREIREDRRHQDNRAEPYYQYNRGASGGLPDAWVTDLWHRQN